MSQVIRKYSNGKPIKLDDSKLFQRDGFGTYKREDIANNLAKGLEQFIVDEKMNEKDAQMFREIVGQAIQGTRDGRFTKMDTSGIHNTMNWNSSGVTEGKKFLGINVGGQRAFDKSAGTNDGRNNALNALNRFYTKTLDSMSTYDYDKELKAYTEKNPKKKYDANTLLEDTISKQWYGGNGIDWTNYSKNRTEEERRNMLANYAKGMNFDEIFNTYDFSNTNIKSAEDFKNLYLAFATNIANKNIDNADYNSFAALGGKDLDQFINGKKDTTTPVSPIQGRVGNVDTSWNHSDYDRTIDAKGQYHIYKKGTGEEVSGILPGNVFEGVGNKYAFNGNIYDDSNLPEQYKQDIERARQAQLGYYTQLTDNNPFTKMLKEQGYNYITNLSQFAPGIGNNILYGIYSNPSDVNGKMGYYLKDPTTGKAINGKVEYNNTLGQYQFISSNGTVTNLGAYNKNGALTNQGTDFVNYNDTSKENLDRLITAWSRNDALSNPASDAYKMVQNTLSKWVTSENSPFIYKDGQYEWKQGDSYMLARRNPSGQWSWSFNDPLTQQSAQQSTSSKVDLNRLKYLMDNMGRNLTQNDWQELRQLKGQRIQELRNIPESQRTQQEKDEYYNLTSFKNGGVISAQLGVKFTKVDNHSTITEIPEASPEQKERAKLVDTSFRRQQNINLGSLFGEKPHGENKKTVDAGGILKDTDKLKLKAALVDLAGTGLGFIPGMNIASAVTGAGASFTNFAADLDDGFHWGDVGNLAMNLGMDALSLIPVGKSAKTLRALGTISKSAPLIMTSLNAMGLADPELRASYASTLNKIKNINKIDSLKSLNTGDIQNLNAMLGMVLGGKNLAKSRKGFWNTNTTDSGKRRVTAMIDGKQQSLELDEAFFQNTKGKNQVQELKNKFAEQYNKQNKLEGDKAIKPENVAVDTKYFGRRPQSEKVAGTRGDGNWVADTKIGNYWLGYRDASQPRGNANIPFSDAWFYKNGIVGGRTRAEKNDIRNRWAESRKRAGEIKNKRDSEIAQKGVEGVSNLVQALNYASKYRTAPLALPAPGQATPSNRVFVMGDGRQRQPLDKTDPSKLSKPGTYQDRAVHTGGTPVESPNANAVRTVRTINSILEPFVPKTTNLPAVIPASRNANKVVASQTIQPSQRLDQFIEGQIPGGRQFGKQRAKTEREYRDVFHPAAEREYNAVWDEAVRNRKDFGYEEVFPKRSPYAPPTPTEVYVVPEGAMKDPNARYLWELINKKPNTNHTKRADLPHKKSNKKKKTSKDNKVKRREWGGLLFKNGGLIPKFQNPAGPLQQDGVIGQSNAKNTKSKFNFSLYPEDVLSLGRMFEGLYTNNKVAQLYKDGLQSLDKAPVQYESVITGDSASKNAADYQADTLLNVARNYGTSDAQTHLAGLLEANAKGVPIRLQGIFKDIDAYKQSRLAANQINNQNILSRVTTANENLASDLAIKNAKGQIDASKVSTNYASVLAPWLAGIENKYAKNRAVLKQYQLESSMNNQAAAYQSELASLQDKYKNNMSEYIKQKYLLDSRYKQLILDEKNSLTSNPWLVNFAKSGSKLGYKERAALQRAKDFNKRLLEDNKRFHKDIMESKREHNKLLKHMSSLTAALIKKGLNL